MKAGTVATILTILFVGLKLAGFIDWSWWFVFSPLWISLIIAGIIMSVVGGGGIIILSLIKLFKRVMG